MLASHLLVALPVGLVEASNVGDQRVVRVRVGQQRADRQEDYRDRARSGDKTVATHTHARTSRNSQGRRPVVLEDVKADPALLVDVGVVDGCHKVDLGGGDRWGRGGGLLCVPLGA